MADCIHYVDECPDCGGIRTSRLERVDGVTDVTLEAGLFSFSGPGEIYIGPAVEPCDPGRQA